MWCTKEVKGIKYFLYLLKICKKFKEFNQTEESANIKEQLIVDILYFLKTFWKKGKNQIV